MAPTDIEGMEKSEELGEDGVEDMIVLNDLKEGSILWNLCLRYNQQMIYTYTGSILVAVNPYTMFDIYGLNMVKKYEGQVLGTLPPHLFAIGSSAYGKMIKDNQNQVIVISGESGAGKTESTKLLMQYLAAVNRARNNIVTEQILEATPLLEAFGNAKTIRNDNSSRFGKYVEVYFKNGQIKGAKISEYLLEKSRIVTQSDDERNYHVFYEMLAGLPPEQKEKYGLKTANKYFYLKQGGNCSIEGKSDRDDFKALQAAMDVLALSMEEQQNIFQILASVLHLGNLYFEKKQVDGQEAVEIGDDSEIKWVAHLLNISGNWLKEAVTMKATMARGDRILSPIGIDQALDSRDAISKALYSTLFTWLVARVNQIVNKTEARVTSIAILDIFGFEDFTTNSFEQLCINFANETLQFYFNKHVFRLEQQEYAKEQITWQQIDFKDNQPVLDLIARRPIGILHILDDESNFPRSTDKSFLEKLHYTHVDNPLYDKPRMSTPVFVIEHYAGRVTYQVENFIEKNKDTLRNDVMELLTSSKNRMISNMFKDLRDKFVTKTVNKSTGRFITMKPRTPTVAASFNESLLQLIDTMSKCNPFFVRCIKPNNKKAPMMFDMPVVLAQLRYTGMLETIRIRKLGFPIRLTFKNFENRYHCFVKDRAARTMSSKQKTVFILEKTYGNHEDEYQIGCSKVFMRESFSQKLEQKRYEMTNKAAFVIQRAVHVFMAMKAYRRKRVACVIIQAHMRQWIERKRYMKIRRGILLLQSYARMRVVRNNFIRIRNAMRQKFEAQRRKREKAERERNARAVAGVAHLEIPPELAYIFSKLDDWKPYHHDNHVVKCAGLVKIESFNFVLPEDINAYVFTKYTAAFFKEHMWGMLKEPIRSPFLAFNDDLDIKDSVAIFKLVLRFMNDANLSGRKELVLADYIVQKGLAYQQLRDEILCQICNQCWRNVNPVNVERGWLLMANCLSCFQPSQTLYKYLLKFVSDQAFNGYKQICQLKLLQSYNIEPQLSRTYPPCMLEWKSNKTKCNMALETRFSDGKLVSGHVESWMTGEEFARHLLHERNILEGSHGWTVDLHDENDLYELAGYDYILDLISEMEIPPAFPVCKSFFLVSSDKTKESSSQKRELFAHSPHNPDVMNIMDVPVQELPEPIPMTPPTPPPSPKLTENTGLSLSTTSALNKRRSTQAAQNPNLSKKSNLNRRYMEIEQASKHHHVHQHQTNINRHSTIREVDEPDSTEMTQNPQLMYTDVHREQKPVLSASQQRLGPLPPPPAPPPPPVAPPVAPANKVVHKPKPAAKAIPKQLQSIASQINQEILTLARSRLNTRYDEQDEGDSNGSKPIKKTVREITDIGEPSTLSVEIPSPPKPPMGRVNTYSPKIPSVGAPPPPAVPFVPQLRRPKSPLPLEANVVMPNRSSGSYDTYLPPNQRSPESPPPVPAHGRPLSPHSQLSADPPIKSLRESMQQSRLNDDRLTDYDSQPSSRVRSEHRIQNGHLPNGSAFVEMNENRNQHGLGQSKLNKRYTKAGQSSHAGGSSAGGMIRRKRTGSTEALSQVSAHSGVSNNTSDIDNWISGVFDSALHGEVDELSDIRSVGRVIRGGKIPNQLQSKPTASPSKQQANLMARRTLSVATEEMDDWLDDMFDIDDNVNDLENPHSVAGALKGGGNQPGDTQTQAPPTHIGMMPGPNIGTGLLSPGLNPGLGLGLSYSPLISPVGMAGNLTLQPDLSQQLLAQQIVAQQLAQQQLAAQQQAQQLAAAQQVQQMAAQQAQQQLATQQAQQQLAAQHAQQHTAHQASLEASLQQATLQNQLLQQTIEQEHLKKRLAELEKQNTAASERLQLVLDNPQLETAVQPKSPPAKSHTAPKPKPFKHSTSITGRGFVMPSLSAASTSSSVDSARGRQSGVSFSETIEQIPELEMNSDVEAEESVSPKSRSPRSLPPSDKSTTSPDAVEGYMVPFGATQNDSVVSTPDSTDKTRSHDKGATEEIGQARKVKIGKVRWPPIKEETPKKDEVRRIGKLFIEEQKEPMPPNRFLMSPKSKKSPSPLKGPAPSPPRPPPVPQNDLLSSPTKPDTTKPAEKADTKVESPKIKVKESEKKDEQKHPSVKTRMTDLEGKVKHLENRYQKVSEVDDMPKTAVAVATLVPPPIGVAPPPPVLASVPAAPKIGKVIPKEPDMMDLKAAEEPVYEKLPLIDPSELEKIFTKIYGENTGPFYTYTRVPWKLRVRKEVFLPNEKVENPLVLDLIFYQIVQDTYDRACIRIGKDDRVRMKGMLEGHDISKEDMLSTNIKTQIKKNALDIAKEWPLYFSRMYPVSGGHRLPSVQMISINHTGIRLVKRQKDVFDDQLHILEFIKFEDVLEVSVPVGSTLQINKDGHWIILYTHRANEICSMINAFCIEKEQGNSYVRAIKDYITRESTLLSFKKGDLIKLTAKDMQLNQGWLFGTLNGKDGMFPIEYVTSISKREVHRLSQKRKSAPQPPSRTASIRSSNNGDIGRPVSPIPNIGSHVSPIPDGKYSMMEFAMLNFRQSLGKYEMQRTVDGSIRGSLKMIENSKLRKKGADWSWKEQADMVKWSRSPIQASLLPLSSGESNKIALECFICIMKYMGDYPLRRHDADIESALQLLKHCHRFPVVRDEVYCQLCKQTTNNKSIKQDSCQKGWRLISIMTSWFECSEKFRPYLVKYLQTIATNRDLPNNAVAKMCLLNLRKTLRFGGRTNVPSAQELLALTEGRVSKRQRVMLPGGNPVIINVKPTTITMDLIEEVCLQLGIEKQIEMEEYALFYIIERERQFCQMGSDEYIFDVTTDLQNRQESFSLLFQRLSWFFPIKFDAPESYIELMFQQTLPDYFDGFLVITDNSYLEPEHANLIGKLAALKFKSDDKVHMPTGQEIRELLPRNVLKTHELGPSQWINMVHDHLQVISRLSPTQCKIEFLEILSHWRLFGSTFFRIQQATEPSLYGQQCLLAVNKEGVYFLHHETNSPVVRYNMSDILSTRRGRSEGGKNYLEIKCGNLMMQKIVRLETDQGTEIASLIGQYIQVMNTMKGQK